MSRRPTSERAARCWIGTDDGVLTVDLRTGACTRAGLDGRSVRALVRTRDGRLLAGTGSPRTTTGGALFELLGDAWRAVAVPDERQVWSIAEPGDGGLLFGTLPPALFRSTPDAALAEVPTLQDAPGRDRWTFFGGDETAHVRSVSVLADHPDLIAVGIEVGGVYVSEDGGATWHDRTGPLDEDVHSVQLLRHTPGGLLAACASGVYRSEDLGRSWDGPLARGYCVPLCVDATERVVYTTTVDEGTPVRRSDDGGRTWRTLGGDLPAPAFGADLVACDPDAPDHVVYAGNHDGGGRLFTSDDGGASWTALATFDATPRRLLLA